MRSLQWYFLVAFMICQLSRQACATTVCGNNGTAYQQFPNKQLMNALNPLLSPTKTVFKMAPLACCLLQQRNGENCDTNDAPICAIEADTKHTRSFRNICLMERLACQQNVDWRFLRNGNCENNKFSALNCLIVYKPVCAIYAGVKSTFSNECLVQAENMRKGADWRIYAPNVCEEDYIHRIARDIVSTNHNTVTAVRNFANVMDPASINTADVTYVRTPAKFETAVISQDNPALIKSIVHKASPVPKTSKLCKKSTEYPKFMELKPNVSKVVCGLVKPRDSLKFNKYCDLQLRNITENTTWTYLHDVKCRDCRLACMEHNNYPICAVRNGISYTLMNSCFLQHNSCLGGDKAWTLLHEGECKSETYK